MFGAYVMGYRSILTDPGVTNVSSSVRKSKQGSYLWSDEQYVLLQNKEN